MGACETVSRQVRQRERETEYSEDHLGILGLTADGSERSREVILDPRLIRAETFAEDGSGESREIYLRSVDFSVALDDDLAIATIRVLKPRWTGTEWEFDFIAEAALQ